MPSPPCQPGFRENDSPPVFPDPLPKGFRIPLRLRSLFALGGLLLTLPPALRSEEEPEPPVLLRSLAEVAEPAPPFPEGRFVPEPGETIAFLGGTNTFEQERYGFLEERFHLAWPGHGLKLRNLAWQGDVLTHQARPLYFYTKKGDPQPGSVPDSRERTAPGTLFVNFGKMESLQDGNWSIESYRELIDQLQTRTGRIVLLAPTPFFPSGPARELSYERNERLAEVVGQIRDFALARKLPFVDLFTPLRKTSDPTLSPNGIHLSEAGHRAVADLVSEQLDFPETPAVNSSMRDSLRQAIARKNQLWQQYYRPTNWAFLFGDRQHVPASRDPVERSERWFLREIDSLPSLIAEAEQDIFLYAREAAGSAP